MPYDSMGQWYDDNPGGNVSLPSGGSTPSQWGGWTPSPSVQAPSEYWIPPNASFGDNPSGAINKQNPYADPGKPFVQEGTTGGYLDNIGVTIGQGKSTTPAEAQKAWDQMVSQFGESAAADWIKRNPGDYTRGVEALSSERTGQGASGSNPWDAAAGTGSGQQWSGNWFTDPGTSQLEDVIKNQLNQLTNPGANDPQSQLMNFLNQRFQELSQSNGYSPQELAMLNTQGLEPIEALRKASQQRELQRTAAAGYLPTSGLTRLNQQQNDLDYDRLRAQAARDLAVQNVNERTNRLNQALQLGQTALATQRGTNANQLQLSTLLQQLPVQAMQNAMSIVNGSGSPESLAALVNQMVAQQNYQSQIQQQQSAAYWSNLLQTALGALG